MNDGESSLAFQAINAEMNEMIESVKHQHAQCKWFIQLYVMVLGALLALCGHIGTQSSPDAGILIMGIIAGVMVFICGWMLLSAIAHKIAMMIMTYRHIALLRRSRLGFMGLRVDAQKYMFPLFKNQVKFPASINFMPYVFFGINYFVLCGSFWFCSVRLLPPVNAYLLMVILAVLTGIVYPNVCVQFNKHIRIAYIARTMLNASQIGESCGEKRRRIDRRRFWIISILAGLVIVVIATPVLSFYEVIAQPSFMMALVVSFVATEYGALRYALDKPTMKIVPIWLKKMLGVIGE